KPDWTLNTRFSCLFPFVFLQVRNGEVAPIYVINLLISDLIQFCCMIVEVAQSKKLNVYFSDYWEILYRVFSYIYSYSLFASVGFMVCIALERYLVIVHPLWYRCRRTIKSSVLVCVLVWILPVVCVLTERFSYENEVSVISIIFYLLPLPLILFFLTATLKALYASISVPTDEKRRIAGMLILVLLIYTLLFLPAIIVNVFSYPQDDNPDIYPLYELVPMCAALLWTALATPTLYLKRGSVD
ncbi:G-protein coupled receptor 4-like, partial [Centropristis striata]|uniref:G-protein coupled receptor 4-like n=1 Tax=Centropristis striata TaxID=184440 RepID=UPI0027DFEB63